MNPTCPICEGEGRNPRAMSMGEWDSTIVFDACLTCGGAGLIYPRELYQCQGGGCGISVFGAVLCQLAERKAPCNCGGPISVFHLLDSSEWPELDELALAVWTAEDLNLEDGP